MANDKVFDGKAKVLKPKKDTTDPMKELTIGLKVGETKKEFITKLGKKICGDDFQMPVVF